MYDAAYNACTCGLLMPNDRCKGAISSFASPPTKMYIYACMAGETSARLFSLSRTHTGRQMDGSPPIRPQFIPVAYICNACNQHIDMISSKSWLQLTAGLISWHKVAAASCYCQLPSTPGPSTSQIICHFGFSKCIKDICICAICLINNTYELV